jgi:type II secretory pathway pseudopilin PulG
MGVSKLTGLPQRCLCSRPGVGLHSGRHRRAGAAFSLVELLISVVAGVALVSAVAYTVTAQIRGTRSQEQAQRSRDDATRLNYLIQTEASEAVTTAQAQAISNCDAAANGRTALFSLTIPRPTAQFDDLTNVVTIHYYSDTNAGITDLRRCGPAILRNGALDFSTNVDGIVNANTTLTLVTCNGTSSSNREVAYQLQLNDVGGGYQPPCAIARAKAFRVVDPATP